MIIQGTQRVDVDVSKEEIYLAVVRMLNRDPMFRHYIQDYNNGIAIHKGESEYKKVEYCLAMLRELVKIDDNIWA